MTCSENTNQVFNYEVYEYDVHRVPHKSGKNIVLDFTKIRARYGRISSESVVITFFEQMFDTINTTSGFCASFNGCQSEYDEINISWKSPHWKLVKLT